MKAELLKREQDTQFQKKLAEYLDKLKRDAVIRVNADAQALLHAAPASAGLLASRPVRAWSTRPPASSGSARARSRRPRATRSFEITPTAGWRFGGTTSESVTSYIEKINVQDSLSWGVTVEFPVTVWGS